MEQEGAATQSLVAVLRRPSPVSGAAPARWDSTAAPLSTPLVTGGHA